VSRFFQVGANDMGRSIEWRSPREGRGRTFRKSIQFGRRSDSGTGYMSYSDRVGPSIILLHEFFGLQDSFKGLADGLNDHGFTVLAPDLYDGVVVETVEDAQRMAQSLDDRRAVRRVVAAAEHLTANWHPRLGVIGFSLGASFAVALAQERSVDAVVLFYGLRDVDVDRWNTPILGHYAEVDEWMPPEEVRSAFEALAGAGIDAEMHTYPGTGHWFANPAVQPAYDPSAADLAMNRTIAFLRRELA
jgi:carboxymethylenebutenolidase